MFRGGDQASKRQTDLSNSFVDKGFFIDEWTWEILLWTGNVTTGKSEMTSKISRMKFLIR